MTLWKCFQRNWFWPILALLLLGLAQMFWPGDKWRQIEQNVRTSISSDFKEKEMDWVQVDTHNRGRNVLLSGEAPSEEDKQKAIRIAADLVVDERNNNVAANVQWAGNIAEKIMQPIAQAVAEPVVELSEGNLQLSVSNNEVTLAGIVANEAEKKMLEAEAKAQYPASKVINHLTVGENIKPRDSLNGFISGFGLSEGVVRVRGGKVTVTGNVETNSAKEAIGSSLLAVLGSDYELSNRIEVVETGPSAEEICQAKVQEIMSTSKVYFLTAKSEIKSSSNILLDGVGDILSECTNASVEVAGHTDATGSEEINIPLSKARAQAVVDYLIANKGIVSDRLISVGYGSAKPVQNNKTKEGRAANRRIEFIVK